MKLSLPDELKFITNSMRSQKDSEESMKGKTCVITGATSGVGRQGALSLAEGGADIVFVARNRTKAEKLQKELHGLSGGRSEFFIADFTDLDQVRKAADGILDLCSRIDVLINSVGVHYTRRTLTSAGLETVFCVNHVASFLITIRLLPRLRMSAPSRIIQVNSEGHRFNGLRLDDLTWEKRPYIGLGGYGASKTAQLMTVWELSDILKNSGITINAMHPGAVRTGIGSNNGPIYRFYLHYILWPFLKDPVVSGKALYYLASSPELRGISGKFFHLTNEEVPAPHAVNREKGKQVFEKNLELTGIDRTILKEMG